MRMLISISDRDVSKAISIYLNKKNIENDIANDGIQALMKLVGEQFDYLLIEDDIVRLEAKDVLERIKERNIKVTSIFANKKFSQEKLLKITIPETLNYSDVFNDTFKHYLKECEIVDVKTTCMGSMFRLSFRVVLKNPIEEKELIDEIRIRNGNLEISILPYVEDAKQL